jgi:hypothetical protein
MTVENGKRIITFEPTDKTIGKNVARIPKMEIPDEADPKFKTFMSDIIQQVKDSIRKQSAEQLEAQRQIDVFQTELNACTDSNSLMAISGKCATLPKAQQAAMRKRISAKVADLGLVYDKSQNKFVTKEVAK